MKNAILTFLSIITVLYLIFSVIGDSAWIANWPNNISKFYINLIILIFIIILFAYPKKDKNDKYNNPYFT